MPDEWVPVLLGDVRIGDTVRTVDAKVPQGSRYLGAIGTVVGVRSGSVSAQMGADTVVFWPDQLERLARPE